MSSPEPLIVVPVYVTQPVDLELIITLLESIRKTEPESQALLVDDGSPADVLVDEVEAACDRLGFELHRKGENSGFSKTVNVGLRRALVEGRDAVLVNADVEFPDDGWLRRMQEQPAADMNGDLLAEPAAIVGGLLLYPNGLIQHAGIFYSLLTRDFGHIYNYAPGDLPEAQHPRVCPVTGALQFIRHSCLTTVGIYDENFTMGWEDVDYCIRTFLAGLPCVYAPTVRAYHHEQFFRGRPSPKVADWQAKSWIYFMQKYARQSFADFVPSVA